MPDPAPITNDYETIDDALRDLCAGFIDHPRLCRYCELVEPGHVPSPYYELLVHESHMTATLTDYYERAMTLQVLSDRLDGDSYRRKILLTPDGSDRVAELGLVRIDLRYTPAEVREAIVQRETPLGDILIRHDVLRRIEPRWFLHLAPDCALLRDLPKRSETEVFGRVGTIHCNGAAAIELLEIVTGAGLE